MGSKAEIRIGADGTVVLTDEDGNVAATGRLVAAVAIEGLPPGGTQFETTLKFEGTVV